MLDQFLARKFIGPSPVARPRIFALAVLPASALVQLLLLSVLIYALSYAGLFIPLLRHGSGAEPSDWVLWMADPAWEQVFAFSFLGLLFGFLLRGFPLLTMLGLALVFPGFFSVKAMACLFLFERLGGWVRALWGRRDLPYGLAIASMTIAAILWQVFGQLVQMGVVEVFRFESMFHPISRFATVSLVVGLGLAFETAINLVTLHFYYLRVSKA